MGKRQRREQPDQPGSIAPWQILLRGAAGEAWKRAAHRIDGHPAILRVLCRFARRLANSRHAIALYGETQPSPQINGVQPRVRQRKLTEVLEVTGRKTLTTRFAERLRKCVH